LDAPSRDELRAVAVEAARAAGDLIRDALGHDPAELDLHKKGAIDLVTDVDRAAEATILARLRAAFPHHGILAEESGGEARSEGFQWLVDPLDGTTNFAHGHPHCAVSLALLNDQRPLLGVIFDPGRDELFVAVEGAGAELNGRPLRVSRTDELDHSLMTTGFAYDRRQRADAYVPLFQAFMVRTQGVRRMGAASLDLAWVAAGRFDGFWEYGLNPWDVAAGLLLVTEAGGRITDYEGGAFSPLRPTRLVASNGRIHSAMLDVLALHRELWTP
jgi:myo-inositol-1(or 4)-monophosphatase